MTEKEALFLLNQVKDLFSDKIFDMKSYAGSYQDALSVSAEEYCAAGIFKTRTIVRNWNAAAADRSRSLQQYGRLVEGGVRIISSEEEEYPKRLLKIRNPPALLYVRGKLPPDGKPAAAIVGARQCSEYGASVASYFAKELSENGIGIVSGLAFGIDAAAAEGALSGSGESYAVLGTGINICYPKENYALFRKTVENGGIITEFPPGSRPFGYHFLMRNRLIIGLSDVLLVIEARKKSGTVSTVEHALDQGKEVFALPGRINDDLGYGCNCLIRDGAGILTGAGDILEYFGTLKDRDKEELRYGTRMPKGLTPEEERVYSVLSEASRHIEEIAAESGLSLRTVMKILMRLELMGAAHSGSAAYYRRA